MEWEEIDSQFSSLVSPAGLPGSAYVCSTDWFFDVFFCVSWYWAGFYSIYRSLVCGCLLRLL